MTRSTTTRRGTAATGAAVIALAGLVATGSPANASEEHSPAQMIAKITGPGSINDTAARWAVEGTDLGLMWDNGDGETMFAIGDTFGDWIGDGGGGEDWRSNGLLRSSDTDFTTGMELDSAVEDAAGDAAEIIPSLKEPGTEHTTIPTAGIAVDGRQYLAFMSVREWGDPGEWDTNFSRIAYSDDNGATWNHTDGPEWTNTNGENNFQMVGFVRGQGDGYIYMHGTPNGRLGAAHVARVPEQDILDKEAYSYWDGENWVLGDDTTAVPVVEPKVSELSVQYHEHSGKWLMMYLNEDVDVVVRTAPAPEGPWDEAQVVASTADYPGLYSPYMHPWNDDGPEVHFMMSLWGPYNIYQLAFEVDAEGQVTNPNLIADPSFERAGEGPISDAWSCTGPCGIDHDIASAYSGSNRAWMRDSTGWVDVYQEVQVEPHTTYHLSAFVTTGGEPGEGALGVRQAGPGEQVLAEEEFTQVPEYERQALTFDSGPNDAVQVYVGSHLDGDRWVQVDDFALVAAGEEEPSPPTVEALAESLDAYVADGAVAGPIVHQLANALDQVEHHLEAERTQPALAALDQFIRLLDNPKQPDTLTEEAAADLREQAAELQDGIG